MITLPTLASLKGTLTGKRVLLRLDLNVPLRDGNVLDAYRIERSMPTLEFLRSEGARTIVIAHLGKGKPEDSLAPVARYLEKLFPVTFLPDLHSSENARIVEGMENGSVVLLENLRHDAGEEANDSEFAKLLASYGEIYVNDGFSVSHRAHASVVGVASLLPHYAGLLFAEEVAQLEQSLNPERPFLFILGGAKIETKMPLLKKFLDLADSVFIGGAIVNNFLKVAGKEIGTSVYDADELAGLEAYLNHPKLILPVDVVVKRGDTSVIVPVDGVHPGDMIVDIGTETIHRLESVVGSAKLIVWNGPLGFYEEGFKDGTRELLDLVGGSAGRSIIGGGDTVALIDEMHAMEKFTFVSTGGGAMLDFLEAGSLPGIDALRAE
ncbi:MAG TPA: phosphoglycerate kinase [Candidatus Paceibacterota bacterium]|nr:phosphoglycerate kinase [Candidatus Paceibacterota bacterium]